jgi:signal transduction histidine kinase
MLSRLYEEAQQTIDAREEVLKVVSHDLRNPLHTIAMSTQLMLEVPMADDKRVKQLTMIRRAGESANRLVQDLLDVAKMEAGRLAVKTKPVEISAILNEAKEMLQPLAAEQSIRLELYVADSLPMVNADAGRLLQVLSNLVGNAIKFTPAGGCITIAAQPAAGQVRISVADTGAGIPAEQLPHIFGRFWQADRSDRRGIGLGLAIAKGIVEAHGGRIWVESTVEKGTTFYFTLGESSKGTAGTRGTLVHSNRVE